MTNRMKSVLESIVIAAILLVLVQTFLEDFAVLIGWSWDIRKVLLFAGFFFDLFFTVEFLARLYAAVYNGRGATYFFRERGWIDFAASIPLLLLSSGPAVLALLTGGSAAFALGGSRPLPELFETAGLRFDFSSKTIAPLMDKLRETLKALPD